MIYNIHEYAKFNKKVQGMRLILCVYAEVVYCVIVAYILHHFAHKLHVIRCFTVFNPIAEDVAQNTAEILMSCIRKKASGIGKHAYKSA